MRYTEGGPAVMLGDSTSLFPAQLAAYWRSKGMEVVLVTRNWDAEPTLPDGTRVLRSHEYGTRLTNSINYKVLKPILHRMERAVPHFKGRFSRRTGLSADNELLNPELAAHVTEAWGAARAALSLRPRFVFGQEAASYGLPTALCRGVPKILFPWGGDVMIAAEQSPFHFALTKFSLRAVDLVVPGATTGARHIRERFGVSPKKVRAVPWGVDRDAFSRANSELRRAACARWGIDPDATIFLNVRRFRPAWGGFVALEAFIRMASEFPATHFILFGGAGTEEFTSRAETELREKGLLHRFTLLEGDVPLKTCAELMSVSDVFVSLLGRGDMRSSSVIQATASGGVPVVSDLPEYREMERLGFAGFFVQPDNVEDALSALRLCIRNPGRVKEIRAQNNAYIAAHEDYHKQMDTLLDLIESVCSNYRAK